jgi:hypothetical protein
VFTVKTSPTLKAPPYWRFAVDDVFNGRTWSPSDPQVAGGAVIDGPAPLLGASTPDPLAANEVIVQHFKFSRFYQFQLPAAFEPVAVNVPGERLRYDPSTGVLFDTNGTHPGFSYDVTSQVVIPTADQLDAVTPQIGAQTGLYTKLPHDIPREILRIAQEWTAGAATDYGKVMAIQAHLRAFQYSTSVPPGHTSSDILRFLTVTKAGYCEQFAGTMAVLLRAVGIPARVAVGFTGGSNKGGVWQVTSGNAHAWVEVPFPGFGWLTFDPTPGRADALATYDAAPAIPPGNAGANPPQSCADRISTRGDEGITVSRNCRPTKNKTGGPQPTASPRTGRGLDVGAGGRGESAGSSSRIHRSLPFVLGGLGLILLLALGIPTIKALRRRLALARAADPRNRVLSSYLALTRQAADLGLGRQAAETLWEYRNRLKERIVSLDGDLDRLTGLAGRAAYADSGLTSEEAEQASASARVVTRTIRRSVGVGTRVVGWFRIERRSRT